MRIRTTLVGAFLLIGLLACGCTAYEPHRSYTTVPLEGFSVVFPADQYEFDRFDYEKEADGSYVSMDVVEANNDVDQVRFCISRANGQNYNTVKEWAEDPTDDVAGMREFLSCSLGEDLIGATWGDMRRYEARGGEATVASCMLGDRKVIVHFIELDENSYAVMAGSFPSGKYAANANEYEGVFDSFATEEWMASWTGRATA